MGSISDYKRRRDFHYRLNSPLEKFRFSYLFKYKRQFHFNGETYRWGSWLRKKETVTTSIATDEQE